MDIPRSEHRRRIDERFQYSRAVAVLGPRQCGKTTLAHQFPYDHYFDLEIPNDLEQLRTPQTTLERLEGLIVIDEVQRTPELFPLLRYLIDTRPKQKYLILGSASRDLLRQSSESLAGRISYYELGGFDISEVGDDWCGLWLRGGLPRSYLADTQEQSVRWRKDYITTFLERDIPSFGIGIPSETLRRFWLMLAHYHGQLINYSEIAGSFGATDHSIRGYLDVLVGTLAVRSIQPWQMNLRKRLVKRPKIYVRDSGVFHSLMSIEDEHALYTHPKLGASWEGFVTSMLLDRAAQSGNIAYFWATHSGAELDLFWQRGGKNWGIEIKYQDAPGMTKSIHSALRDLELEHVWIVYPGQKVYPVNERVTVIPVTELHRCPI